MLDCLPSPIQSRCRDRNREAILRLFRISNNRAAAYEPQNANFPGYQAPVVRKAADGERELTVLNWGFMLLQDGRAPKRVTNVRDDKALTRFWRASIEQRRWLVPASKPHASGLNTASSHFTSA
jgi:putative SOS response-associated peptidase YedK